MASYATTQDVIALYRPLTPEETQRVAVLLPIVIDSLRQEAHNVGKDLDQMVVDGELSASVVKSVAVDVVARTLMTPTDGAPMTQMSQSALGYSVSGTYLVPAAAYLSKNQSWHGWACAASGLG